MFCHFQSEIEEWLFQTCWVVNVKNPFGDDVVAVSSVEGVKISDNFVGIRFEKGKQSRCL